MSDSEVVSTALAPANPVEVLPSSTPETPAVGTTPETLIEAPKVLTVEELQKKFDRDAAHQRRKYEREVQQLREDRVRLEERLNHLKPAQIQASDGEPKLADYTDFQDFSREHGKWVAREEFKVLNADNTRQAAEARAQAAQQQSVESFTKKVADVLKEMPDWHERMAAEAHDIPMTRAMQEAIQESAVGPKLAYYLLDHAEEAAKIAGMTPIGAVRALTLIEEGFKKPVAVTQATPPITPTGNRSTAVRSLKDITSQDEFEKRRREQIAKRR